MTNRLRFARTTPVAFGILVMCFVLGAAPSNVAAQQVGVRAGISGDPTQFYFGGHFETRPLVESLTFRPNVEIGLGDDVTLTTFNIEFAYKVPLDSRPWTLYFGGGPALVLTNFNDDTDTGGGFNLLAGIEHTSGLFTEFKVGLADSPGFKFGVGYTFNKR